MFISIKNLSYIILLYFLFSFLLLHFHSYKHIFINRFFSFSFLAGFLSQSSTHILKRSATRKRILDQFSSQIDAIQDDSEEHKEENMHQTEQKRSVVQNNSNPLSHYFQIYNAEHTIQPNTKASIDSFPQIPVGINNSNSGNSEISSSNSQQLTDKPIPGKDTPLPEELQPLLIIFEEICPNPFRLWLVCIYRYMCVYFVRYSFLFFLSCTFLFIFIFIYIIIYHVPPTTDIAEDLEQYSNTVLPSSPTKSTSSKNSHQSRPNTRQQQQLQQQQNKSPHLSSAQQIDKDSPASSPLMLDNEKGSLSESSSVGDPFESQFTQHNNATNSNKQIQDITTKAKQSRKEKNAKAKSLKEKKNTRHSASSENKTDSDLFESSDG